ncbi:hypothetical protein GJAV_G00108260 [Gymnothorax javanicus]|nr:hypothetical protein GJAV_G00108260 [Gymnothorax javanicus]
MYLQMHLCEEEQTAHLLDRTAPHRTGDRLGCPSELRLRVGPQSCAAPGMFAVFSITPRTGSLLRSRTVLIHQRPRICSKPPKHKIGAGQSLFIMSVFAITMLAPAGWILHHIPEYRHRPNPPPK